MNNINGFKIFLDYEDPKSKRRADEERHKKTSDDAQRSQEEKRKHVKSIIDKIPTAKAELFNFPLDWAEIDATIEKKVRPWINKKIIEYIGEPEPTLVDFICSKVLAGSTPQSILDDVQMVSIWIFYFNLRYNLRNLDLCLILTLYI